MDTAPICGADRNAEVLAEDTVEDEDKAIGIWGRSTYSILRCLGCDIRYIRRVQACSEDAEPVDDPETGERFWSINEQVAKAHPAVPGWSICSMRVPCAGDQRRAEGTWDG